MLASTALAENRVPLRALTWIAGGHEADALTTEPAACLALGGDRWQIDAGRALFNAPQLLGGQAARADISCASCHSNGRRNPHFFLAGVSDGPGTADVSSSFFSPARGNGRLDPKPIPDLALPGRISRDPENSQLERFLRGLIVEEFSGAEPSAAQLSALAAYVRALRPCETERQQVRSLDGQLSLLLASVQGAAWFRDQGDRAGALVLLRGARHQLGLIDERLVRSSHRRERRMLREASNGLLDLINRDSIDAGALMDWQLRFERDVEPRLRRAERRSLFNPAEAERWLADR